MGPFLFFGIKVLLGLVFLFKDLVIIIRILLISPGFNSNLVSKYSSTCLLILSAIGFGLRMYIFSRIPETRTLQ
jgi:hypothetical protein